MLHYFGLWNQSNGGLVSVEEPSLESHPGSTQRQTTETDSLRQNPHYFKFDHALFDLAVRHRGWYVRARGLML